MVSGFIRVCDKINKLLVWLLQKVLSVGGCKSNIPLHRPRRRATRRVGPCINADVSD
jgi:hypothetical protein